MPDAADQFGLLYERGRMMERLSGFILSVIAASLIISILGDLMPKGGPMGALFRLVGGMFLAFTIISPVVKMDFSKLEFLIEDFSSEGAYYSEAGKTDAQAMYRSIIKDQAEAYILDKANLYGADMQAEVSVSEEDQPIPVSAKLTGKFSPYAKKQISDSIERDLGISKENQNWMG